MQATRVGVRHLQQCWGALSLLYLLVDTHAIIGYRDRTRLSFWPIRLAVSGLLCPVRRHGLTIHSSRSRFAARLNSGVMRHGETSFRRVPSATSPHRCGLAPVSSPYACSTGSVASSLVRLRHGRVPTSSASVAPCVAGCGASPKPMAVACLARGIALGSGGSTFSAPRAVPHNHSFKPKPLRGSA